MIDHRASRTALAVAMARARHTRLDRLPIFRDDWADRLVPDSARALVYDMARVANPALPTEPDEITRQNAIDAALRASPAYPNAILRARYTEDALHRAVSRGTRQYLLIGAGFDSYGLRRPPEGAGLTVIEIDHPASQAYKRECVAAVDPAALAGVHYVAADLATEDLAGVLRGSPMRASEPAFFSWLGVTLYLTREANLATLRAIATTAAPGSELVFTYFDQALFAQQTWTDAGQTLRRQVASVGEPFVSGFDPGELARDLEAMGLRLLEDCPDAQLLRRYDPEDVNGITPGTMSRIAHVRVQGSPAA